MLRAEVQIAVPGTIAPHYRNSLHIKTANSQFSTMKGFAWTGRLG
jgi:hypothetical protein